MSKSAGGKRGALKLMSSLCCGAAAFAGAAAVFAWTIQKGALPVESVKAIALTSLFIGAAATGCVLPPGGRNGLLAGGILALCYLLWKLIGPEEFTTVMTLIGTGICVFVPWVISCIFHKGRKNNTKRNRRATR